MQVYSVGHEQDGTPLYSARAIYDVVLQCGKVKEGSIGEFQARGSLAAYNRSHILDSECPVYATGEKCGNLPGPLLG